MFLKMKHELEYKRPMMGYGILWRAIVDLP